jgi:hypothetical protein
MGFIVQLALPDPDTGLTLPAGSYCCVGNSTLYITRDDRVSPPIFTISATVSWYASEECRFSGKSPIKSVHHRVQVSRIEEDPYRVFYRSYASTLSSPVLHV